MYRFVNYSSCYRKLLDFFELEPIRDVGESLLWKEAHRGVYQGESISETMQRIVVYARSQSTILLLEYRNIEYAT